MSNIYLTALLVLALVLSLLPLAAITMEYTYSKLYTYITGRLYRYNYITVTFINKLTGCSREERISDSVNTLYSLTVIPAAIFTVTIAIVFYKVSAVLMFMYACVRVARYVYRHKKLNKGIYKQ